MARKKSKRKASELAESPPSNKRVKADEESSKSTEIDNGRRQSPDEVANNDRGKTAKRAPGQLRTPPPSAPPSVVSSEALIPPHADDPTLRDAFDLHVIQVTHSSKMEAKVRRIITLLNEGEGTKTLEAEKPRSVLIALVSRAPAANKCISIAEIAKRELLKNSLAKKWYQYTSYWLRLEELKVKHSSNKNFQRKAQDAGLVDRNADSDDNAFDPPGIGTKSKVRNVPCLLIYLSTRPVARLQSSYT
jgi:Alba